MRIPMPDGTIDQLPDHTTACTGHLGKFTDCRTEALYIASLVWQPEQTGSVEWYVWACIMSFPTGQYLTVDGGDEVEHPDSVGRGTIWIPAGAYVLTEDDRGFVQIEASPEDGHGSARARFDQIEADYATWLDQDGEF